MLLSKPYIWREKNIFGHVVCPPLPKLYLRIVGFQILGILVLSRRDPLGGASPPQPPLRNMRGSAPQTPRMKYNVCQIELEKCWTLLELARAN